MEPLPAGKRFATAVKKSFFNFSLIILLLCVMAHDIKYPIKDKIKAEKKVFYVFFEKYTTGRRCL